MTRNNLLVNHTDPILITGANGFIGTKVVETLLGYGFSNLRCFVRPSGNMAMLNKVLSQPDDKKVRIINGNLLSREDCERIAKDVPLIYHLAAGSGVKSYPDAYLNSVVTTRNLLDATVTNKSLKRFVNVSSFTVYSNQKIKRGGLLDETCELESQPKLRGDAYCYAKVHQDALLMEYHEKFSLPFVIIRPGVVYGPGKKAIHGRIGIGTFGLFLHLGGSNKIPLTYVDNCAEAIVLAGLTKGVDSEVFNIVDDDLPTSRAFLKMYKKEVKRFRSLYIPYRLFYLFSYLWEKYSKWSDGQLPPAFNRRECETAWKGNTYSNKKIKELLGWQQKISTEESLRRYAKYQLQDEDNND